MFYNSTPSDTPPANNSACASCSSTPTPPLVIKLLRELNCTPPSAVKRTWEVPEGVRRRRRRGERADELDEQLLLGMLSALNESAIRATLPISMGVFQLEAEKRSHPRRYLTKSEKLKTLP